VILGKWIKGALIGAGSFGKVYLGMDAVNGLLMAVKQVELPRGSAPNEERKKNMLSALEREIDLLKDLSHPNIVQYLCKSARSTLAENSPSEKKKIPRLMTIFSTSFWNTFQEVLSLPCCVATVPLRNHSSRTLYDKFCRDSTIFTNVTLYIATLKVQTSSLTTKAASKSQTLAYRRKLTAVSHSCFVS
jgi:serine/threonine protein kinase